MTSTVRVVVRRSLWHQSRQYAAGEVIEASEADAVQLVDSGRAELHNQDDAARLRAFALADLHQTMQRVGPVTPQLGSPWIPLWPR